MPALKLVLTTIPIQIPVCNNLLLRRTLASTTAVNPPSNLSPPATHHRPHHQTLTLNCITEYSVVGGKSTLARGARLRVMAAHVKTPTPTRRIKLVVGNNRKRLYMLSSSAYSSFSSSSFESEEREKSATPSSSSSSTTEIVMGRESNQRNDVVAHSNDTVSHSSKLLTLPTILTLARVVAIPLFIGTFYVSSWWGTTATTSIFVAAAITDWLDGYLARKMRLGTVFGAFLDPVADKLMVAATLILLCNRPPEIAVLGDLPWLFPVPAIAIIGREITMSAVREWAASQNTKLLQAVAVNNLGKWKTATQMIALTLLLAARDTSLGDPGTMLTSGVVLLYISAGLAVWSLVVYMRKIWVVLLR